MTQEEFDKAPKVERILYDKTGMLAKNHTDIIDAMTEYAESEVKKLNIFSVSQHRELLLAYQKWYDADMLNNQISSVEECVENFLANNCG